MRRAAAIRRSPRVLGYQTLRQATTNALGVVGIRREDKNAWERRVPLTPEHVRKLTAKGIRVICQPSSIRAFANAEYEQAGAEVKEDLSEASTICAVKEVPVPLLLPDRTYMMFSHTHKAQPYNMPLLDAILAKNIRLIDFERIADSDGRVVKFGPYAGFAGMIDTLHALGIAILNRHQAATAFLHVSLSKEYRSLDAARQALQETGDIIRKHGLPPEVCPLTFVVTGNGSVSQAAQQILHHLPCQYVEASELKRIWNRKNPDRHCVYVCVATPRDMVAPKDPERKFEKSLYYKDPSQFVPTFHEEVMPYARVVINGMYWEEKYPRLVTCEQAKRLHREDRLPLLALGEITCDPYGSIEFFRQSTSIAHPIYAWDPESDDSVRFEDWSGRGPLIVGVDHLPAEFPIESSQFFGDPLVPLVEKVANSDGTLPLEEQLKELPEEIGAGILCANGKLTPNYEYITDLRAQREVKVQEEGRRRVVFLGAGMVSGPAVRHLLQDPRNSVVVADQDVSKAEQILNEYAGHAARVGRDAVGRLQDARAVAFNTSSKESLDTLVKDADLVVSLVPWTYHPMVMEACLEHNTHCVTASYVTPALREFHDRAKAKHLTFINELGLDPGIDIMSTLQMLDKIRKAGGIVRGYQSFCGALPEPESARNTMGYKFSWSPRGVLLAAKRPSKFLWKGQELSVPGDILYETARPFKPFRSLALQWVPNGDAMSYRSVYGFGDELDTCVRATLRYDGFAQSVRALRELGLLEPENKYTGGNWNEILAASVGAPGASGPDLQRKIEEFLRGALIAKRKQAEELGDFGAGGKLPPLEDEIETALAALTELRLTNDSPIPQTGSGQVIDALAETMQNRLYYAAHEQDFVLMYHRFDVEYPRGRRAVHESSLAMRGSDAGSATAITVGLPVGIAAQQVLDRSITATGVIRPITADVYDPIMHELRRNGVQVQEDEYDA